MTLNGIRISGSVRKSTRQAGYVIVKARKHGYRDWCQHRAVIDILIKEWNPFGWVTIPSDMEVHHMDHARANNEPHNLVLMDETLHAHCHTGEKPRYRREWSLPLCARGFHYNLNEVPF